MGPSIHPLWGQQGAGTPPCVHPLRCSASSLAYRPMSGSDTICNNPNPPLADIALFGFPFRAFLKVFKTHQLGRGFHILIQNVSFSSPTDVRSHIDGNFYRFIWKGIKEHIKVITCSLNQLQAIQYKFTELCPEIFS